MPAWAWVAVSARAEEQPALNAPAGPDGELAEPERGLAVSAVPAWGNAPAGPDGELAEPERGLAVSAVPAWGRAVAVAGRPPVRGRAREPERDAPVVRVGRLPYPASPTTPIR